MTQKKHSAKEKDWKEVWGSGPDGLRELVQQIVQEVLEAEMDEAVGAQKSERTQERLGYRSGYYARTLVTRVGKLELRIPQDRQGRFRTEVFERYQRSEKALVSALAEMYIQGVSTRKVKEITEQLCGHGGDGESGNGEVGRGVAEIRGAAAGRGIPVPDSGCAIRESAGRGSDPEPGGASGDRDQLGRTALRAGSGISQPGERQQLERVSGGAETARIARGGVCDQ
jgi:hypothetical protein